MTLEYYIKVSHRMLDSRMFPDGCSSNVIWATKGNGYIMFPQ